VNLDARLFGTVLAAGLAFASLGCAKPEPRMAVDATRAYIDARVKLFQAADANDPVVRSQGMEALVETIGYQAGGVFKQALSDKYPSVRFAAAMAIGDVKYKPALATLVKMAKEAESDKRVFIAVIYALCRLGNTDYASQLGTLLFDTEREVRADAALVMGKLGEPSAIGPLKTLYGQEQDPAVQLALVEALASLGDNKSADVLEAYAKMSFLDLQLVAIPAIARSGSPRAVAALRRLLPERQPPRVRVAAAGALAKLGIVDERTYELCCRAAEDARGVLQKTFGKNRKIPAVKVYSLQRLAALSLGQTNREPAVDVLYPLLNSPDGSVRVAAAMSILKLLAAYKGPSQLTEQPAQQAQQPPEPDIPPARKRPKLHSAGGRD